MLTHVHIFVSNIQQNMLTYVHIFVSDVQQSGLEHNTFVNNKSQVDKNKNNNKLSQQEDT